MSHLLCFVLGHRRYKFVGRRFDWIGFRSKRPRDWRVRVVKEYSEQECPFSRSWCCWRCGDWVYEPETMMERASRMERLEAAESRRIQERELAAQDHVSGAIRYEPVSAEELRRRFPDNRETNDFGDGRGAFYRELHDPRFKPEGYGPNDPLPDAGIFDA